MKKMILGLLLIYSIVRGNVTEDTIVLNTNPANVTYTENGRPSHSLGLELLAIEEVLLASQCPKDRGWSYVMVGDSALEKKSREQIEKDRNDERNDPRFTIIKPNFIPATHLAKGSTTRYHECVTVNLWIEDLKGCIVAQKQISASDVVNSLVWSKVFDLAQEAAISLHHQMCNAKSNEQTCLKPHYTDELFCPYYTMQTVVKKIEKQEPPVKTGGRNSDLTTVTLKDTKQVIYIDTVKGKIINAPFVKKTSVKKTSEKYKLNTLSCQYEIVKKDEELPYYKSSFTYLNNFSSSAAFTKDTVLDLQISSIKNKVIKVPWNRLKKSGHFSDTSHWTKKKTQIGKDTEARKMLKLNAEGQAKLPLLKEVSNFGIAVEQALGEDTKETKCEIQREFYDVLENGANIIHPKISYKYKVDISQSSKSDIKEAKKIIDRMENFSGSYTEEKQIYDGLNNPLYAPKRVKKEKTSSSEQNPRGILDTLVPQDKDDISEEISIDDLEMFTN